MHILIIHQAFASLDEAGGTRHAEFATQLVKYGHQVTIIASPINYMSGLARSGSDGGANKTEHLEGITIFQAPTIKAIHRSFFIRLIGFFSFMISSFFIGLRIKNVDIVWGTSPPIFQGVSAWFLARLKGAKFLFEIRDLWPSFAVAIGVLKNRLLIHLSFWLERTLYAHADLIIVNSPGFIDHVRQRGAKRIELIPNGTDTAMFDPFADGKVFREAHGIDDKFVLLYAGAHGISNDLGTVLEAACLLKDKPEIQFVFVGDGKEKVKLIDQAKEMGLTNVLFLDSVPKKEMCSVLAAANACVAILKPLKLYNTTYPNKVFDYMASARPVVLAIDGVIHDLVDEAGAGIFSPPGNPKALAAAVEFLFSHPEVAKTMGNSGRKYIEIQYDRRIIARKLLETLEKLREK